MKEKMKELKDIKELLMIIDMVNGFVYEGALHDKNIAKIIPDQIKALDYFVKRGEGIGFAKESHNENSKEFTLFPPHCIKGTSEAELVPELKLYEEYALQRNLVYEKNSTCVLFANNCIEQFKQMKNLKRIVVAGCCTDICVLDYVYLLPQLFHELDKDVEIIVPKNLVDTFEVAGHIREEVEKEAFTLMKKRGIYVPKKYIGGSIYE